MGYEVPCKWTRIWPHTHITWGNKTYWYNPKNTALSDMQATAGGRDTWHTINKNVRVNIWRPRNHSVRQVLWNNDKDSPILMTSATLYHVGPTMGEIMTVLVCIKMAVKVGNWTSWLPWLDCSSNISMLWTRKVWKSVSGLATTEQPF